MNVWNYNSVGLGNWSPFNIFVMVIGFVLWWPIGLAAIAYIMSGGEMKDLKEMFKNFTTTKTNPATTGNVAFDQYKEETIKRLEQEQKDFGTFMHNLAMAKDKAEFDQFMAERKS